MKKSIKYTSLLFSLLCVCSCSNEDIIDDNNPTTKEEMTFSLVMDEASVKTRAYSDYHTVDTPFEDTKSVVIGISNGSEPGEVSAKKLKVRKRYPTDGSDANIVYWDDVSSDTYDVRKDAKVNIWAARLTQGVTTASDGSVSISDDGKITWTIDTDQKTKGIDLYDLLAADYQSEYTASKTAIPLCFHHAMTKITVNVKGVEGFTAAEVTNNPSVVLSAMNTEAVVDLTKKYGTDNTAAETGFINPSVDAESKTIVGNVDMHQLSSAPTGFHVSFDAIVVPGNVISVGTEIATIKLTNANQKSNTYTLKATQELLNQLAGSTENVSSITFAYGTHYIINATVNKQEIILTAKVVDWNTKEGAMDGKVLFSADVTDSDQTNAVEQGSFDLWMATTDADASYGHKASTYTYNTTDGWKGDPVLYWPNGDDSYYFRALATYSKDADKDVLTAVTGKKDAVQGTDLLWAQTSEHTGTTDGGNVHYEAGAAINPRTGDVPLTFQHAMSKISVELQTVEGAKAVNLENSKISIINLYNGGTIDISNGKIGSLTGPKDADSKASPYTITDQAVVKNTVESVYQWLDNIVIPQSLTKDKDNTARGTNPSYYSSTELIAIYPNVNSEYTSLLPAGSTTENTSLGTGEPKYYLASDLRGYLVSAINYAEIDIELLNTHNAGLSGSKHANDIKEPELKKSEVTYSQFKAEKMHQNITSDQFNNLSDGARLKSPAVLYTWDEYKALKPNLAMTQTEFDALSDEQKETGDVYTQEEIDAAKAIVNAAEYVSGTNPTAEITATKNTGDVKLYTLEEYRNLQPNEDVTEVYFNNLSETDKTKEAAEYYAYEQYHALDEISETLFNRLDDNLVVKPQVLFTEVTANEYNATLTGALHVGDVKVPAYYKLPSPAPTEHHIGDLKDAGNKIMLYVTLSDGTIYSIDLATCKDSTNKIIEEWEGGYHYKYTITLTKEEIKFRALVKNWNDVEGSGNATLDWD